MLTPDQVLELTHGKHADELRALEQAHLAKIVGPLEAEITRLLRNAGTGWIKAFGSLDAFATPDELEPILAALRAGLGALPLASLPSAVLMGLPEAFRLGAAQAQDVIPHTVPRPKPQILAAEQTAVLAGKAAMLDKVGRALILLGAPRLVRWSQVSGAVAQAAQVVGIARATVITATHGAANRGGAALIAGAGLGRMWVPERDGCNRCQAFAGQITGPAGVFAPGTYYGDGAAPEATRNPPLHPHCRCKVVPVVNADSERAMREALQREARRTIAKGWTEAGGESNAAALRATQRLLDAGARLPKSVLREAELAVDRGGFVRRTVPTGT
jgi:hypothetical protein